MFGERNGVNNRNRSDLLIKTSGHAQGADVGAYVNILAIPYMYFISITVRLNETISFKHQHRKLDFAFFEPKIQTKVSSRYTIMAARAVGGS